MERMLISGESVSACSWGDSLCCTLWSECWLVGKVLVPVRGEIHSVVHLSAIWVILTYLLTYSRTHLLTNLWLRIVKNGKVSFSSKILSYAKAVSGFYSLTDRPSIRSSLHAGPVEPLNSIYWVQWVERTPICAHRDSIQTRTGLVYRYRPS